MYLSVYFTQDGEITSQHEKVEEIAKEEIDNMSLLKT